MPTVFIPPPLRDLTGGVAEIAVDGSTVREVVEALECQFPGIKPRLCRGDSLAPGLAGLDRPCDDHARPAGDGPA